MKYEIWMLLPRFLASIAVLFSTFAWAGPLAELPELATILPVIEAEKAVRPCSREGPKNVTDFWVPSEAEVLQAEKRLHQFLADEAPQKIAEKADAYRRQYVGLMIKEKRVLYINAFLDPKERASHWRTQLVVICDGGPIAWGLVYDLAGNEFLSLKINFEF